MSELDILAFAAHPDDTDLCCGGTLAALVQQDKEVGVIDLTRGEMGSRGTPELRDKEAQEAAKIIGLSVRKNLAFHDTRLQNDRKSRLKIIHAVRKYRPHICLVGAPTDRHPDHGNATQLTLDAIFYSGLIKIETQDDQGNLQAPWRPSHILHYMQDQPFQPDVIFDITDTFETKQKAILAFGSQFNIKETGDEPETYISSSRFFKQVEARARHYGHQIGTTYGEPFKYYNGPLPFNSFNSLFDVQPKR